MKEILKQNILFFVVTVQFFVVDDTVVLIVDKKLPFRLANKHYLPCV